MGSSKTRHWILTVWLVYWIVVSLINNFSIWFGVLPNPALHSQRMPIWWNSFMVWRELTLFVFYCAIWYWKKWGAVGVALVLTIFSLVNAYYSNIYFGWTGIPVQLFTLYTALYVGGEQSWLRQAEWRVAPNSFSDEETHVSV